MVVAAWLIMAATATTLLLGTSATTTPGGGHAAMTSSSSTSATPLTPPTTPHTMCIPGRNLGVPGGSTCMPLENFLLSVLNKSVSLNATVPTPSNQTASLTTEGSVSVATTLSYYDWLLAQNASSMLEHILQAIGSHVTGNLTNERVRAVLQAVELLANTTDVIPVTSQQVLRQALVNLSRVPQMDEETVTTYAQSMSGALERDLFRGPDEQETLAPEDVTSVLEAMEQVLLMSNVTSLQQDHQAFELSVRDIALEQADDTSVILYGRESEVIELSPAMFAQRPAARVATVVYKNFHTALPARKHGRTDNNGVVSRVISVAVGQTNPGGGEVRVRSQINLDHVITFTVQHRHSLDPSLERKRICVYWNSTERGWSGEGCRMEGKNVSHTTCSCDHLTSFAVLVLYLPHRTLSALHSKALFILSSVGCGLSILGLLMTLCCYLYLKILQRERIMIHANLALALLLAQVVFLASQDAHSHPVACKVAAILLHFLLLSAQTWMLVEGIALYLSCTRGLYQYGDMRTKYFLLGWGLPVVIVLVSFGVQYPNYGDGVDHSCWLSVKSGLIWAFMGPMLLVVLFNLIILGMVIKVYLTLRANQQKSEAAKIRGSLRALGMLLPLLGTTWLISLLVPLSSVFHYLFVIGNSLQGILLFFLHCVWNQEVRKVIAQRRVSGSGLPSTESEMSAFWRRRTLAWHIYTRHRRQFDPHSSPRDPKDRNLWI